jgi:hypothetical protein
MSDGHCVYQGLALESAAYFNSIGFNLPKFSNPADTFMKILAVNYPQTPKDTKKIQFFLDQYNKNYKDAVIEENKSLVLPEPNLADI